ncbi:MAG: signal peptidase I [Clostridiales bacterium]|nr:signal peptidase I [Clostridiales bacterium]
MSKKRMLSKFDGKKHGWLHFLKLVVIAVIVTLLVIYIVLGFSRVDGSSMQPTLSDEQVVTYFRLSDDFQRGDIVAITMPSGDKYVKRIIGVEGDVISIKNAGVYRNGKKLQESYVKGVTKEIGSKVKYPYTVEANKVFVMGDNRENSIDSRTFGPIVLDMVKGKLLFQ